MGQDLHVVVGEKLLHDHGSVGGGTVMLQPELCASTNPQLWAFPSHRLSQRLQRLDITGC